MTALIESPMHECLDNSGFRRCAALADSVSFTQDALLVGCSVSGTFIPALEQVVEALQARHPKATTDQLLDMVFLRGLTGCINDMNLPRTGSNPDVDG